MSKKIWNNIEIILITLSMLLAMFTAGLILGVYVSSNTIEELSNDNIVKERTIQQQKERIRELQEMKQLKEIYNGIILLFGFIMIMCNTKFTEEDGYVITFVWAICRICLTFENRK